MAAWTRTENLWKKSVNNSLSKCTYALYQPPRSTSKAISLTIGDGSADSVYKSVLVKENFFDMGGGISPTRHSTSRNIIKTILWPNVVKKHISHTLSYSI